MRQISCEQEKIIKGNKRSKEISQVELLHVDSKEPQDMANSCKTQTNQISILESAAYNTSGLHKLWLAGSTN